MSRSGTGVGDRADPSVAQPLDAALPIVVPENGDSAIPKFEPFRKIKLHAVANEAAKGLCLTFVVSNEQCERAGLIDSYLQDALLKCRSVFS